MMRRVLVGSGSLLLLVGILIGVPAALLTIGFNPATLGTIDSILLRLSMPDDGTLLALILTLAAWAAWAYLTLALLIETTAILRRIPTPHIRGLGIGQLAAKRLLAGVALLFVTASPLLSTTTASATPPPPAAAAAHTQVTTAKPVHKATESHTDVKVITVKAGDSLAELAAKYRGNPSDWGPIFKASRHIDQPGGRHLTDPNQIDIGWTLHIPLKSTKAAKSEAADLVVDQAAPVQQKADPTPAAPSSPIPSATATAAAPSEVDVASVMQAPAIETEIDPVPIWAATAGVGAVLAAGVVGLVTYRRRLQMRRWRPGHQVPLPAEPGAAAIEQELRAVAPPMSLEVVDAALRALATDLTGADLPLPEIRAARLTADRFELYLTDPTRLPAPWQGTTDTTVWILENTTTPTAVDVDGLPAPYPSLVTIGQDQEDGNLLVDLEHLGALAIQGAPEITHQVLAALAIELGVSPWADDLTVTVVGAFADLEGSLQTGRIRYLPTPERLIEDIETRAATDREAIAEAGVDSARQARATLSAASVWPPEIIILAGELTDRQHNRLASVLEDQPRVAVAAITSTGQPLSEWAITLGTQDTAILEPIGITITPQRIPADQYTQMLGLVEVATYDDLIPTATDSLADTEAPAEDAAEAEADIAVDLAEPQPVEDLAAPAVIPPTRDDEPAAAAAELAAVMPLPSSAPLIRLLGPVELDNAIGPVEPTKRGRLIEYAAYLHLHPGSTPADIDDAIWPARTKQDNTTTRNTATSKLRRWLGQAADGELYLPLNRYQLKVDSDWARWRSLLAAGPAQTSTTDLTAALSLVRGRPFSGVHPRRYAWAEPTRQTMITAIVEASYELARRRLLAGDWRGVETAIVIALSIEPALEHLWRLRLLAAHHAGDTAAFNEAKARLLALTDELGLDLEPETEELLRDLTDDPQRAWEKAVAQ